MSYEDLNDAAIKGDALRAANKADRREKRRQHQKQAPVEARYGIWTGEGFLREGQGLEKLMAEKSLGLSGTRRQKRRTRKANKK
ncbi:MAG: hypothetical protein JWP00_2870 [Chloroflexi bacterium]|jgi:hypothetical protein|nr:hypothetical protein [Chloroflexota bacterium]